MAFGMSNPSVHEVLLSSFIEKKKVPHLLLFSGKEPGTMKMSALSFAKKWLQSISTEMLFFTEEGSHPDIHYVSTEGKLSLHSITNIRLITEKMAYSPFKAAGKVIIIDSAERMLPTSANALLKSLEEPLGQTVIILTTTKEELLIPTIRSRCVKIMFQEQVKSEKSAEIYSSLLVKLATICNFSTLVTVAEQLAKELEEKKRQIEKQVHALFVTSLKEMNAHQRQRLEQEIEGAITAKWFEEVESILQSIFELYRDVAASRYGVLPEHRICSVSINTLAFVPLEQVDTALSFAKLSLERSTPVSNVFEDLLYKLILAIRS